MDHIGIDVHKREVRSKSSPRGGEMIERRIRTEPSRCPGPGGSVPTRRLPLPPSALRSPASAPSPPPSFRLFPAPMIGRYNTQNIGSILVVRPPLMKLGQAECKRVGKPGAPPQAAETFLPSFLVCGRRAAPETRPMLNLPKEVPNDA